MKFEHLLQEGKIGSVTLRNRMIMPGMGTNMTGHSNPDEAAWYAARAKGGFGLVVSEYNCVTMEGIAYPGEVYICKEEIPGYRMVTDAVHETEGAKIFMQIHHAGRQSFGFTLQTGLVGEAPSPIPCTNARQLVHEMTTEEIYALIDKFGKAGEIARRGGFDGCELHFGHGYLGSEFMSSYLNKRTDEFGGTLDNRARFACECIKAIKKYAGEDFPISVRVSGDERVPEGRTVNETAMICMLMEQAGADMIVIATNTMHKNVPEISEKIHIPIIHIAEATADALLENGVHTVGLLGTKYTMLEDFYKKRLLEKNLNVIIPDEDDVEIVNHVIFDELCLGIINDESRNAFSRIISLMKERGAEAVILGCTEIGLLISQKDSVLPVYDTTVIHAETAARLAIEEI